MERMYCTAIVLAGGSGKRMGTSVHKQYLLMGGKPVLYYSLKALQDSELIDEIILVTGAGEETYCRETIVDKYSLSKVSKIIPGGAERYLSVWNGLLQTENEGYIFIHDGARPFVNEDMIRRGYECVDANEACVAAMPVKDTIKIVDCDHSVKATPDRSTVWQVQTPQIFQSELVKSAYKKLIEEKIENATDDAMVVEAMSNHPVKVFEGSYLNLKITTPEDLEIAEVFLKKEGK